MKKGENDDKKDYYMAAPYQEVYTRRLTRSFLTNCRFAALSSAFPPLVLSFSSSFRSYCNAFWCSTWLHAPCLHHCRDLSRFSFFFSGTSFLHQFFLCFFFFFNARTRTSALLCDSLDTCAHSHKHILYLQRFSHCSLVICHFFFFSLLQGEALPPFFFSLSSLFCFFFFSRCFARSFLPLLNPSTRVCVCVCLCVSSVYGSTQGPWLLQKEAKRISLSVVVVAVRLLFCLFFFFFFFFFFFLFDCVRVFFFFLYIDEKGEDSQQKLVYNTSFV